MEVAVDSITYKSGYKYQLSKDYIYHSGFSLSTDVSSDYIDITKKGILLIRKGYAWDGPSGPAFDTKCFMRASLIHDAFYQLIREGLIPPQMVLVADIILYNVCIEDGMSRLLAKAVYIAVSNFGHIFCSKGSAKPLIKAP